LHWTPLLLLLLLLLLGLGEAEDSGEASVAQNEGKLVWLNAGVRWGSNGYDV